jgi:hypothetical protein
VDRIIDLLEALIGHPNVDLQVDMAGTFLDVQQINYDSERAAVVLRLGADDLRDVLNSTHRP